METQKKLAAGEETLEQLLVRIEPNLRATLGWFSIPREDGEDLLQQCFLTFVAKREDIRHPEAWLLGTVRRRCLMYWRRRRRDFVKAVDSAVLELIADGRPPEQELADLRSDLNRAIRKLPTRCRSLLHLRYSRGLSPVEAAESLGYSSSGIYKIIDRCLEAFSQQLVAGGFSDYRRRDGSDPRPR